MAGTDNRESYSKAISQLFTALPATQEYPEPLNTTVKGRIPEWISGSLLRNGPSVFQVGNDKYNHFFDGLSNIHRFNIQNGRVTYQSKFLRSDDFKRATGADRIVLSAFGTFAYPDPCKNIFQRFFSYFKMGDVTDNGAVNIVKMGEDFCGITETHKIRKVDPKTLATLGEKIDYADVVSVNGASAHPHIDNDGTVYNIAIKYGLYSTYHIVKIPPADKGCENPLQKATIACTVPMSYSHPAYYHSFGISENYYIYIEQPLVVNIWKALLYKPFKKPVRDCIEWHPEWKTYFHIIRRDTGEELETKYMTEAMFLFHHANAYEKDHHLIIDVFGYHDSDLIDKLFMKSAQDGNPLNLAEPWRFILPLNVKKDATAEENLVTLEGTTASATKQTDDSIYCIQENIFDIEYGLEFPTVNYRQYNGKEYRYMYCFGDEFKQLFKGDCKEKTYKSWEEEDCFPAEPIFVPAPDAKNEDEGVVLSAVMNVGDKPSFLLVLDGETFEEIGRAEVPVRVHWSAHGFFEPE
ncbi:beta,beta-carotene 15,15'-dioxygenase-like [Ptychodera flava]|uniref:beta,beta-carotene 15,15'-dioxygenase-like n=1 Tax=Ptychodera flava TaxID=63121 RepID=UPI00396A4B48